MRRLILAFGARFGRVLSLVLLASLGSTALMRYSPGYFSDAREMDGAYAHGARAQLNSLENDQASLPRLVGAELKAWSHGDLGRSRHYEIPVTQLLRERYRSTVRLLVRGIAGGWLLALAMAVPLSARRTSRFELAISASTAVLLAVPVGVLATVCLLLDKGGPVLVLALLIAVRDFKLLYRLLQGSWRAPHIVYARAQGFSPVQSLRVHLLPVLTRELITLAMMSVVVALSALVPVEVIFDLPGLGQLAWDAATNRDLPVLVAVSALLASCVGFASLAVDPDRSTEMAQCA